MPYRILVLFFMGAFFACKTPLVSIQQVKNQPVRQLIKQVELSMQEIKAIDIQEQITGHDEVLLAYQIDRQIRGHKFYETAYYLPVVLSLAVTGIIWNFLLRPDGFVNGLMGRDIDNAISFFGNYDINIYVILTIASWRHIGYIMLLYLAGLKSVDMALREASALDGATEWQTFKKVIFPSMKPVNIIVIVITIIESLRAFDIVYIIYGSSAGFPILGTLVFQNIAGEGASMKGAAYAVILFVFSIGPIIAYLRTTFKSDVQ
jgi:multiple sugar transport system permease protein/raffinose/stachyose/melibiose transport system permease protein